jgi:hypothetical protein
MPLTRIADKKSVGVDLCVVSISTNGFDATSRFQRRWVATNAMGV